MLDYLHATQRLSPEEKLIQESTRAFCERQLMPHIAEWWDAGEVPVRENMKKLGAQGLLGPTTLAQYGGSGSSYTGYGLMMYELERVDSGLRSAASVQGSLVMHPIDAYGSEDQKHKYLPGLASGELIGCFGLTEADGGSDPGAMRTRAHKDGDEYVLNGNKMWITNAPVADIAVIWAKDDEGVVRGFLVPTDAPGFSAPKINRKMSLRASLTGEIVLQDCRIPAHNLLPGSGGLKSPLGCLTSARFGIAFGALGALEAVYTSALAYTTERTTFGKPIAARQLVQDKLVTMLTQHALGLGLALQLGALKDAGQMTFAQVSLAKRNNVRVALSGARLARELLGGNGITTEYPVIRHMLNLETVDTYEGTHDIHTLIVGREITGLGALE
ncbi:acyl-CoA dehydrogenase family protein [Deinococcus sp.]|uniref:acyl-CoA dehydrogenase family protein n=1 Tax=Deinococcus sp. TaxID=47478 RepID=UPI003B5BBD38